MAGIKEIELVRRTIYECTISNGMTSMENGTDEGESNRSMGRPSMYITMITRISVA